MKVIHVIPSIADEASGPTYSVSSLSRATNDSGTTATVVATGESNVNQNARVLTFPRSPFPHRLGRSPEMYHWLSGQVTSRSVDVIHNHSIWMMPNVYPGWVTRGTQVTLVVSPRGTFSKWALDRQKVLKGLFWNSLQRPAIAHARLFHATADSEHDDIRRLGFRQPVAIIPNGIDVPKQAERARQGGSERTLLFLSRLHPTKGLEYLLQAWAALQHTFPKWKLRIIGPGDPTYLRKLAALASTLRVDRVTFEGPLYGRKKNDVYHTADLFVLPTHSENFGMAVAEALAAGCPVITTKGAPWRGLIEQRAGWWVDIGVEPLQSSLEEAMSREADALTEMGARGRHWMERDFSWDRVATQMVESYRWIREGGTRPVWIHND